MRFFPYRNNYSLNKEKRCKHCNNFNNQYRRLNLNIKQTLQNCLTVSKNSSKKRLKNGRVECGINTLTIEQLLELYKKQKGQCSISGVELSLLKNSNYIVSIDRINSNKGYTIDNIHLVTKIVNQAKNNLDLNTFHKMICDIYNNINNKISINNIKYNDDNIIINKLNVEIKYLLKENNRLKQKITELNKKKQLKTTNNVTKPKVKILNNNIKNKKKVVSLNNTCKDCNKEIYKKSIRCKKCNDKYLFYNSSKPSYEQLLQDVQSLKYYTKIGNKYNVSDNAVRKWFKKYEKYNN